MSLEVKKCATYQDLFELPDNVNRVSYDKIAESLRKVEVKVSKEIVREFCKIRLGEKVRNKSKSAS